MSIVFKINGKQYKADGRYGPDVSLNEYIRTVADLRGTKAMCHEGGCGACVVAVRAPQLPSNELKTFAVNSCLVSVLSCQGWEIFTVEGIGNRTTGYHDIQKRLAMFNGTQCGYCTPGWIMNMYGLYESKNKSLTTKEIENSFAGNICRCTGYRPIADAFKTFATDVNKDLLSKLIDLEDLGFFKDCGVKCNKECSHKKHAIKGSLINKLHDVESNNEDNWCIREQSTEMLVVKTEVHTWYKVHNLDEVFKAMADGNYRLVAGNTGQGVYHIIDYPKNVIDISSLTEIKGYELQINLVLGAGMPLSEMMEVFLKLSNENEDFSYLKEMYDHMDLVAHIPVRNIGTIGGNLFLKHTNKEFQSDVFLLFEVVGAMITIAEGVNNHKTITLPEFLETDMTGKLIINVMLPPLSHCCSLKTYKIMQRSQNTHAIVNAGFLFKFHHDSNLLEKITIVYGGISPKFIHAAKTEASLVEKDPYSDETIELAFKKLSEELQPEEAPPEPSAAYRKMLAIALFYKAILSTCPDDKINPKFRSGGNVIKRDVSNGTQTFDTDKAVWPLNKPIPKLEALVQCSGEATFANDLPTQTGEVFAAFVTADVKPGSVISEYDTTEAFKIPGVVGFYTVKDIPGNNTFTPTNVPLLSADEEIFCSGTVKYYGQAVGVIVADREKTANKAARLVKIKYSSISDKPPIITIDDVLNSSEKATRVVNDTTMEPTEIGNDVKSVINGSFKIEGQYHYYMEPQTCVVKNTEDGIEVYSATQWLDLTNVAIAGCLNIPINKVNVIVRRVGGGYGGKISRSSQIACAAALVSHLQGKPCRLILPIETNMKAVGKRVPTSCNFEVGVNDEGEIQYLKNTFYQDYGNSFNEAYTPITVQHFKNCYDSKRWKVTANSVITDTPSNTWCRAPASTEGVAMIEYIMERIAKATGKDAVKVRLLNMNKENNPIPDLITQLQKDADYNTRVEEIKKFNDENRWRKRAIKLAPLTYDVFYFGNYNSLVSIYHGDGTVVIIHGGIEMGQGLNTKAAQVCAYTLGIPVEKISVKPSTSFTSPNAITTGGSIGSECVAYATMKACKILLERLEPHKTEKSTWEELIKKAFESGVNLQASYMFSNNLNELKSYDVYAVFIIETEVDILTGNHEVRRIDLLEDTGRSLSPEIDVGQIEGAIVMGLGYWTSEKLVYDQSTGELLTLRTWNYKPPGIKDIPADMRIYFRRNSKNESGVLQSKATGEPAFCLATAVIYALRDCVLSARLDAGYPDEWVEIENPCTPENIFNAVGHKLEHFKLK